MKKQIALIFTLLSIGVFSQDSTTNAEVAFANGNKAYLEESYTEAVSLYQSVLAQGVHSKELYLNLGNAYYKKGETAASILYYERGLLHFKNDSDLLTNLRFAENQRIDKIEALPLSITQQLYTVFDQWLSASAWGLLGLLALIMYAVLRLFKAYKPFRFSALFSSLTLVTSALSIAISLYIGYQGGKLKYAIVFEPSTPVFSDPKLGSSILFELHEGTKVQQIGSFDAFENIKIANGQSGWISATAIRKIEE